jgi:GLPGLI family protein
MLKKLFLVSLLMIVTNVFCQKKSGEVCYKVQAVKFELNANDSKINDFTKKIWTISDEQSFTLRFNALKSSFILSQVLKNDDVSDKSRTLNRIASMLVSTPYSYFFDLNEKNYLLKTDEGILIDKPREKLIWEITNETKTIGDYLCYKATCIKSFTGRDGKEKHTPVTAWFAPSLPYSFGPKEYNGLPGLILEVVENKSIFYASSILIYDGKDREVEFPKGKTITEDDYTKKVMSN